MIESLSGVELLHFEQVSDDRNNQQTYRFNIVAHEPYPFLLGLLLREKSIPNRLVLTSDRFSGVATVAAWDDFRRLADKLQEQYGKFELLSVSQVETTGAPLGSGQLSRVVRNELSDDQLLILQVAYKMGYFDTPVRLPLMTLQPNLISPNRHSVNVSDSQRVNFSGLPFLRIKTSIYQLVISISFRRILTTNPQIRAINYYYHLR